MKKTILLLLAAHLTITSFAQKKEEAEKLIEEGIAYHDKGDYEGAITRYDKALDLDKDNLQAYAEIAISLLSLNKYNDVIEYCQKAIKKHPGEKLLANIYVTYGNAYDGLKKTDRSIAVYDEGIQLFPGSHQLHFNKGITLTSVKKYDEALLSFQTAILLNPKHPGSHNAIARVQNVQKKRIPAILAYSRFLVLEPQSQRAKENLAGMQGILKGNAEQKDEKNVTISISPDMLSVPSKDGKPKENSFSSTDLIIVLTAGLDFDEKNKNKTPVERFISKFETICASLKETKKDNFGFYWEYYVPYFTEMYDKKFVETFAYIAFASSGDAAVSKWLEDHKNNIDEFYNWSKGFAWKSI